VIGAYTATVLTLMGIWSIVALALTVITGYAGQFNLGIGVYMGTGAYAAAMLSTRIGFDFWLGLPCAAAAAALMGFVTGLPALRVREDSLAVFTIGLVFVFESLLIYLPYFGGPVGIGRIPRPAIGGIDVGREGYLIIVLSMLLLIMLSMFYLKRTWMGLAWAGIRENELAIHVSGIHPARFKLYAFTIGAAFAGVGGALYAHFIHYITPYDFGFLPSVYVLAMIVFGGMGTIRGAVFGACFLTLLPELFRFVQDYRNLIYGGVLIGLMLYEPRGVLGNGSYAWRHILMLRDRVFKLLIKTRLQPTLPVSASTCEAVVLAIVTTDIVTQASALVTTQKLLQVRDLTRRFGGLTAVNGVSIDVFAREIFGIIGPNGAGKTTLFNCLSGTTLCTSGQVWFKAQQIQHLPPHLIAQSGLARTFQIVHPFSELNVLENVLAGLGARFCKNFTSSFGCYERQRFRDEAHDILDRTGLAAYHDQIARNLPLGLLRRLEIARALGQRPEVILLDESFSGLSHREIESLVNLVCRLRAVGTTILLIEHNVPIVMSICDRIAVLDHGRKIAEGIPAEIREDPQVVAAYLGADSSA
jgi:branched-chain amino acid transport system permease protein